MNKEHIKDLLMISAFAVIVGLVLIFFSVSFGTELAQSWLIKKGGADPGLYQAVIEKYINSFLVTGSIIFFVGLSFCGICYFFLPNDTGSSEKNQ